MTDHAALIERLEKATGPDREIDWLIACGLDYDYMREYAEAWEGDNVVRYSRIPDKELATIDTDKGERRTTAIKPDHYTASLDAAIALVERVAPTWMLTLSIYPESRFGFATLKRYVDHQMEFHDSLPPDSGRIEKTPPIAVLITLLRALNKDGTNNG